MRKNSSYKNIPEVYWFDEIESERRIIQLKIPFYYYLDIKKMITIKIKITWWIIKNLWKDWRLQRKNG